MKPHVLPTLPGPDNAADAQIASVVFVVMQAVTTYLSLARPDSLKANRQFVAEVGEGVAAIFPESPTQGWWVLMEFCHRHNLKLRFAEELERAL